MTDDSDRVTLAWIDDISRLRPTPSPLEVALWLDSLLTLGKPIDLHCTALSWVERSVRAWPPWAQA